MKDRKVLHEKNVTLEYDIKTNIEENSKLKVVYEELANELGFLRKKFGMKDKNLCKGKKFLLKLKRYWYS